MAQLRIAGAGDVQECRTLGGRERERALERFLDRAPPLGGGGPSTGVWRRHGESARWSQRRATFQSRITVACETSIASAASGMLKPAK